MADAIDPAMTTTGTITLNMDVALDAQNPTSQDILSGVDASAAGAVEEHEAVVHVDPFDAAKEVRQIVKDVRHLMEVAFPTTVPTYSTALKERCANIEMSAQDQMYYVNAIREHEELVLRRVEQVGEAMLLTKGKAEALRQAKAFLDSDMKKLHTRIEHAQKNSTLIRETTKGLSQAIKNPETVGDTQAVSTYAGNRKKMSVKLDRLHILSQSLPTFANAPLGDQASNCLRAIAALLKVNGYIKSST